MSHTIPQLILLTRARTRVEARDYLTSLRLQIAANAAVQSRESSRAARDIERKLGAIISGNGEESD